MTKAAIKTQYAPVDCHIHIVGNRAFLRGVYPYDFVREVTSYYVDGYRFAPAYNKRTWNTAEGKWQRLWDGRCHLFDPKTRSMPSGLVGLLRRELREADPQARIAIQNDNLARAPAAANDPSGFNLHGISFGVGKFDYQLEAAKAVLGAQQCILKVATNGGKTEIAAAVTNYLRVPTVFIVPGVDLLHQTRERFALRLGIPLEEIGIVGDSEFQLGAWITLATADSLFAKKDQIPELRDAMQKVWQLMFVDECHTAGSDTFYDVLDSINAFYRVGLSGTPLDRSDGADLKLIAQTGAIAYDVSNKLLIERGISVPVDVEIRRVDEPKVEGANYESVHSRGVTNNDILNNDIVKWVSERAAENRQVLILVRKVAHGKVLEKALRQCVDTCKFLHGSETTEVRRNTLRGYDAGELQVLIGTSILYQGIDTRAIDVIVFADLGKSKIAALQAIGRGLRVRAATATRPEKKRLLVRDYANFCHKWLTKHSLRRLKIYKDEKCFNISVATI